MLRNKTCAVQSKMPCILKTVVREAPSSKREGQNYIVEAVAELSEDAVTCDVKNGRATEKIDGTCCHVRKLDGSLMLWARLDRKPNKRAEKKFKVFQRKHRQWEATKIGEEPQFQWKFPDDLKQVPEQWIPADGVNVDKTTQCPIPDKNGHIPGWVPVDHTNPQYCWHSSVVDYNMNVALTLRPVDAGDGDTVLEIGVTRLSDLEGSTLELIGTNINGNPYRLGDKQHPIHILTEHGCIPVQGLSEISYERIRNWFECGKFSRVEGVVWHLPEGRMFKLHRHHIKLCWPLPNDELPLLSSLATRIVCKTEDTTNYPQKSMFHVFNVFDGQHFNKLCDIGKSNCIS